MSQSTNLMDLSNEILLEIAARVPFEAPTWSSLSQVNRRLNAVMTTDSLPGRAIELQFPAEGTLLPFQVNDTIRLSVSREWSDHISLVAALFSDNKDIQELIGIAILFLYANEIECGLLPKPTRESRELWRDRKYHFRGQFLHLRILRQIPTEIHTAIRYFTLKAYERSYASRKPLPFPGPEPRNGPDKGRWLCDACDLLNFEATLTMPMYRILNETLYDLCSAIRTNSFDLYDKFQSETRISANAGLPILKTGRILPSAAGVVEAKDAAAYLEQNIPELTPVRHITFAIFSDAESAFSENAQTEFREQMKRTQELVSLIEAPDGHYVRNLLDNLDLKAIRSIVTEEVARASEMTWIELQEGLLREIKLITE